MKKKKCSCIKLDVSPSTALNKPVNGFQETKQGMQQRLATIRLLANHPHFGVALMTADRKAGQAISSVFPHLVTQVWLV
jgi:hypothetical protein